MIVRRLSTLGPECGGKWTEGTGARAGKPLACESCIQGRTNTSCRGGFDKRLLVISVGCGTSIPDLATDGENVTVPEIQPFGRDCPLRS